MDVAARTPGLVRLEGHLGWDVRDDLTLIPGGWCWLWIWAHFGFLPCGLSSLHGDGLASLWSGLRVDCKKRASKNCKESSDLGLETVYCHPCPFH